MKDKIISIIVPLSESDISDLRDGQEFNWTFPSLDGKYEVEVLLRPETQEDIGGDEDI